MGNNKPTCPKCGGHNLWADNTWEGCEGCNYISNNMYLVSKTTGRILAKVDTDDY